MESEIFWGTIIVALDPNIDVVYFKIATRLIVVKASDHEFGPILEGSNHQLAVYVVELPGKALVAET